MMIKSIKVVVVCALLWPWARACDCAPGPISVCGWQKDGSAMLHAFPPDSGDGFLSTRIFLELEIDRDNLAASQLDRKRINLDGTSCGPKCRGDCDWNKMELAQTYTDGAVVTDIGNSSSSLYILPSHKNYNK